MSKKIIALLTMLLSVLLIFISVESVTARGVLDGVCVFYQTMEMSRYVQSKNPLNLKYTQYRICFSE